MMRTRSLGIVSTAATLFALAATTIGAGPGKKAAPGCIYGQVVDGHTGEVRCLSPEEVTPPGPYDTPTESADAGADAPHDAATDVRRAARDAGLDVGVGPIPLHSVSVSIDSV